MIWYKLPLEIRILILSMRHQLRQEAQKKIYRCWKKFYAPKKVAQYLIDKERNSDHLNLYNMPLNVMAPDTANIMEYCAKILSGSENPNYWNGVLKEVEFQLWVDKYSGGQGVIYMSRIIDAFIILIKKFKYSPVSHPLEF